MGVTGWSREKTATSLERLVATNVLSQAQQDELTAYPVNLNPVQIARDIPEIQRLQQKKAKAKTDQFYLASMPSALPYVR